MRGAFGQFIVGGTPGVDDADACRMKAAPNHNAGPLVSCLAEGRLHRVRCHKAGCWREANQPLRRAARMPTMNTMPTTTANRDPSGP